MRLAVVLIPWSAFMLFAAGPMVLQSVLQLERFPDTYNAGYFIVKMAVGLARCWCFSGCGRCLSRSPAREPLMETAGA
jgi:hypothetical protein